MSATAEITTAELAERIDALADVVASIQYDMDDWRAYWHPKHGWVAAREFKGITARLHGRRLLDGRRVVVEREKVTA